MLDTRAAFSDILGKTDELLSKARTRLDAASKVAKAANTGSISAQVSAIDQAVAETAVNAKTALAQLAAAKEAKLAQRREKVATALHIAKVAARLLAN